MTGKNAVSLCLLTALLLLFTFSAYSDTVTALDDGVTLVSFCSDVFCGYMLITDNPSRVVLACCPEDIGIRGHTVAEYAEIFDAVAAVNAGGFEDYNGNGDGRSPDRAIVHDYSIICGNSGVGNGFAGIDGDGILHLGISQISDIESLAIKEGVSFGPALIRDGEITQEARDAYGMNPRTAIGQRSDGAILLLVTDGRQPGSLGATLNDIAEIMLRFGAVNASNLDGGNSSLLYYNGDYINGTARVTEARNAPDAFVVLKEQHDLSSAFLDRFGSETVPEIPVFSDEVKYSDNVTGPERDSVTELALEYMRRYVLFTSDLSNMTYPHYNSLAELVVSNGALHNRLALSISQFGFFRTKSYEITEEKINTCSIGEDGKYTVELTYSAEIVGGAGQRHDTRNMRLTIEQYHGRLAVSSMTLY